MNFRARLRLTAMLGGAVLAVWVNAAKADFIFDLNVTNLGGVPPGPYVQVDVHLTGSTHATLTYTSLLSGGDISLIGATGAVGANVNATTWTIGSICQRGSKSACFWG
jgi:hypothetical protein